MVTIVSKKAAAALRSAAALLFRGHYRWLVEGSVGRLHTVNALRNDWRGNTLPLHTRPSHATSLPY